MKSWRGGDHLLGFRPCDIDLKVPFTFGKVQADTQIACLIHLNIDVKKLSNSKVTDPAEHEVVD